MIMRLMLVALLVEVSGSSSLNLECSSDSRAPAGITPGVITTRILGVGEAGMLTVFTSMQRKIGLMSTQAAIQ